MVRLVIVRRQRGHYDNNVMFHNKRSAVCFWGGVQSCDN